MTDETISTALDGWLDVDSPAPALEKTCNATAGMLRNAEAAPDPTAALVLMKASIENLRKPDVASRPHAGADTAKPVVTRPVTTVRTKTAPDAWTDAEVKLCEARARVFVSKAISASQADLLACRLLRRDRDEDDRRSCGECASFEDGRCLQHRQPFGGGGIEVLHRCKGFKLSEVSHD